MTTTELTEVPSLEEIKKTRKPLIDVNVQQRQSLSGLDRLAVWITNHVGSMGFFLIIFSWTILWIGWNVFAPQVLTFDPHPAFVLWLIISNMIQIFLMPLIMIGQNIQGRHAELRAEADFQVNTKSEKEIELILQHLENQQKLISHLISQGETKQ